MPANTAADVAFVNPSVVKWAVEKSPLPKAQIAKKVGVSLEQLEAWCSDAGEHPPFSKAAALAHVLNQPFGYFFLSTPPKVQLPIADFRSPSARALPPSAELLEFLSDALVRRDWYREFISENKLGGPKFVGHFPMTTPPKEVATDIRNKLGINPALRNSVQGYTEYLSTLARHAEDAGILVMRSSVVGNITSRPLSVEEVQGFAIADRLAPLIFINSADYKAPQIFTFAHELAHIWIGQSAIGTPQEVGRVSNRTENYCNRVAALVLVPDSDMQSAWHATDPEHRLSVLAQRFWVSTLVILRRARELGLLSDDRFFAMVNREKDKTTKRQKPTGGDFYRNLVVRMGPRFTYTVLAEVNKKNLLLRDGARLLGVGVPTLAKFANMNR